MRWKISYSPHAAGTDKGATPERRRRICTPAKRPPKQGSGVDPLPFLVCVFAQGGLASGSGIWYNIQDRIRDIK